MILNQAYIFLIFVINGFLIGILFDIFRILRKSFKTKDIITYIEDILFWILTGLLLLYSIFTFSNGELRLYMFLGVFIGCILYMILISQYFIKINVKIILFTKGIVYKIFYILTFPMRILLKILKKFLFKPIHFLTINTKKIQKNINGEWKYLDYLPNTAWNDVAYIIKANSQTTKKLNLENTYGELEKGTYRVIKTVFFGNGKKTDIYSTEFEIK